MKTSFQMFEWSDYIVYIKYVSRPQQLMPKGGGLLCLKDPDLLTVIISVLKLPLQQIFSCQFLQLQLRMSPFYTLRRWSTTTYFTFTLF